MDGCDKVTGGAKYTADIQVTGALVGRILRSTVAHARIVSIDTSAAEALAMGLVNAVVPHEQLDAEVQRWCDEIQQRSPTALAIAKRSFNMDTAHQAGIAGMGLYALKLYYDSDESREGVRAFQEKRAPDFRRHAK
mgnify:CR=1 FL=1